MFTRVGVAFGGSVGGAWRVENWFGTGGLVLTSFGFGETGKLYWAWFWNWKLENGFGSGLGSLGVFSVVKWLDDV